MRSVSGVNGGYVCYVLGVPESSSDPTGASPTDSSSSSLQQNCIPCGFNIFNQKSAALDKNSSKCTDAGCFSNETADSSDSNNVTVTGAQSDVGLGVFSKANPAKASIQDQATRNAASRAVTRIVGGNDAVQV